MQVGRWLCLLVAMSCVSSAARAGLAADLGRQLLLEAKRQDELAGARFQLNKMLESLDT